MKKTSLLIILTIFSLTLLTNCKDKKATDKDENATEMDSTTTDKTAMNEEASLNTLTEQEKEEGWMLLFDGETTEGWRGYKKDHFPKAWIIDDHSLHCQGSGRGEAGSKDGGDIIYDEKFDNFTLKLDWKISEGGNSGIFYLGQEELDYIWKTAPEMQVLDNEKHPDANMGKDGNRQAGSLYDLIPADPQNAKPAGEWNHIEITVYKGTVIHKQNGETVVEYHLWTPEWEKLVADSKFPGLNKDWADVASEGYIGLQDHGDDVWFRNIKLKKL